MAWDLERHAREFYRLEIKTEPPADPGDWEASFDQGRTWRPATIVDGLPAWLVEGVDAPPPAQGIVLSCTVLPLVRLVDDPEFIVRTAPRIMV